MKIVNRWVLLGALGFAILLLLITFFFGLGSTATQADGSVNLQLAALTVIPGPTSTPRINLPPTHDPAMGTATPPPGVLTLNGFAQITRTNGEGLRLRKTPGLNGEHLFLGFDAEVFEIIDGPQDIDGYTWWYLQAPYDETRTGWAASAFLEAISSP